MRTVNKSNLWVSSTRPQSQREISEYNGQIGNINPLPRNRRNIRTIEDFLTRVSNDGQGFYMCFQIAMIAASIWQDPHSPAIPTSQLLHAYVLEQAYRLSGRSDSPNRKFNREIDECGINPEYFVTPDELETVLHSANDILPRFPLVQVGIKGPVEPGVVGHYIAVKPSRRKADAVIGGILLPWGVNKLYAEVSWKELISYTVRSNQDINHHHDPTHEKGKISVIFLHYPRNVHSHEDRRLFLTCTPTGQDKPLDAWSIRQGT